MLEEEFIEDLDIDREPTVYEIGDQVVYPHHGAGKVLKKEMKEVLGEKREYLTIKILHNDMTVMVPCCNADKAGLRRVIGEDDVKKVLSVLRDDVSQMPKNWNRRFKHNREKIKTGDVFELAEVVRNLAIRETEKGLSTGEKQMYTRAKKILASELMYALDMEEDEAESHLEELIAEAHASRNGEPADGVADRDMAVVGIVPAGGSGERLGADRPKAFVVCAGRPLIEWSLEVLGSVCDRVVVAAPPGYDEGPDRVKGGESRSASVRNAVAAAEEADVFVVHDAARPLVTRDLVRAVPRRHRAGCRRRDRRDPDDGHGQGGGAGLPGAADARPLDAVGGADASGVPGGHPAARARARRRRARRRLRRRLAGGRRGRRDHGRRVVSRRT